jgi:metal-sulfur cluster biosynthetic enzyme
MQLTQMTPTPDSLLRDKVEDALREVHDPEISVNVFDLGLIYKIEVTGSHCAVEHTLTSMMCPFADQICNDIDVAVAGVDGVETVDRKLVFDPPFSMEMVPEETKMIMGWI